MSPAARTPIAGALLAASDRAAGTLGAADWREAFAHHPRIGDVESLRERFRSTASWAEDEQRGASAASEATLAARSPSTIAPTEARFGYIFIVCATGKSADEMLALLRARMPNDPGRRAQATAAEEQMKITRVRGWRS